MEWGTKPLYELLSKTDSGVWGDPGSPDDGVPVLRSTNISNWHLNLSGDLAYRKVNAEQIKRYKLEPGDIIVTKSSGSPHLVGQAALFNISTKETYLFSNFMQRLRPNFELVLPEYLLAYLRCPQARSVIEQMHRTTSGIRNLKIDDYLAQDVPIPYPKDPKRSLDEQRRIVARLDALLGEVRGIRVEIRAMREDMEYLMEAVLEGVFLPYGMSC